MTPPTTLTTGGSAHVTRPVRAAVRKAVHATVLVAALVACVIGVPCNAGAQSVAAPAPAPAPAPSTIWFQVAVGGATARLVCDICQSARDVGPALTMALGAHASPRLRIGLEAGRWTHDSPAVRENLHAFGLVAHYTPSGWQRLHWLAGAGWTGYRAGAFTYDAPRLTLGLGWDLPLTGQWVVGNVIAVDASSFAPLRNGDVTIVRNAGLNALRVTTQLRRR